MLLGVGRPSMSEKQAVVFAFYFFQGLAHLVKDPFFVSSTSLDPSSLFCYANLFVASPTSLSLTVQDQCPLFLNSTSWLASTLNISDTDCG